MKRKITLSLVLTLSVLLSLVSLPSTAQAAPPQRFRFATGVITHSIGQTLRVTVNGTGGSDTIRVRFAWMKYMAPDCIGMPAVCRHTVESQGATPLMTLNDNDALSFDVDGNGNGVNLGVESNSRDAWVIVQLIRTSTGEVLSASEPLPTEWISFN